MSIGLFEGCSDKSCVVEVACEFQSVARECWVHQLALLHVLSTRRQLKQRLAAVNLRITAAKFDNSIKF